MRSRVRQDASAQEVRGYYKQFAEAKHPEYKSWVDNEVFDLIDMRWVLTVNTASKVTSSRQMPDGHREASRTDRRNISKQFPLLPQDPDFG